MFRLEARAVRP